MWCLRRYGYYGAWALAGTTCQVIPPQYLETPLAEILKCYRSCHELELIYQPFSNKKVTLLEATKGNKEKYQFSAKRKTI
jgi:hypothetical protein